MSETKTIVWRRELVDWEIGEFRQEKKAHRLIGYAVHKPSGDNYFFLAGFGCQPEDITPEMLTLVTNYIDDRDCSACLSNSVTVIYQLLMDEMDL